MRAAALLILVAVGCAARQPAPEIPETPPPPPEEPAGPPPPSEPEISRAELESVLAAGPAQFLHRVRVRAFRPDGRFRGWEIVGFGRPADPISRAIGVGDVVTRVNGKPLERPEQFSEAWEELRGATTVVVELTRRGEPLRLVFPIASP
jgi:type II secretory pathway component PulC